MTSESVSDQEKPLPAAAEPADLTKSDGKDSRQPYEKPSLEKHSDPNLWAFGSM